jgi:hypothetical protein
LWRKPEKKPLLIYADPSRRSARPRFKAYGYCQSQLHTITLEN